jgi:hypothetical protein
VYYLVTLSTAALNIAVNWSALLGSNISLETGYPEVSVVLLGPTVQML